jgi:hypothetical protein
MTDKTHQSKAATASPLSPSTSTGNPVASTNEVTDTAPRFATAWASLVYAICTMTLAWPALLGRFAVGSHSDQFIAGYPFREFAARMLKETGSFPQWNPYQFGGMPYIAAMHGDIFYPTFLLRMVMPTDMAMTWSFAIHLFLAGLFTFIFLRKVGIGFWGSLIGGIAYMMGGQVASLVSPGHDGKLYVSALFPLMLWALVVGIRDGKKWAWGAIALIVGLDVLSPHPQLLQYSLLGGGAYAIYLAVRSVKAGLYARPEAIKRLAFALGGVVLGGLMGAIQYLPVRGYVAWSPRAEGIGSYERATSFAWNPQELLNVYLPEFSGMLDAYWGPNGIHLHSEYVGVIVLILLGAAFIGLRTDNRKGEIWFWTITIIITLLWSLGAATPFYRIPYYLVPGTKFFRAPATIFFVGALGISFLAAIGTEKVLRGKVGNKYAYWWIGFAALMAVLGVSGGLTNFAESIAPDHPVLIERAAANGPAVAMGSLRSLLFVVLGAGVIILMKQLQLRPRIVAILLAVFCVADLWSVLRHYWIFSEPASQLYASDPAIEFLQKQPQPVRVLPLSTGYSERAKYSGSGLMVHNIRNTVGYHGNQIRWYNDLLGFQNPNQAIMQILGTPNLRQLTNTQYILTNSPEVGSVPGATLAFGPVKDAHGEDTYVYKMTPNTPFAWVTPAIVKAPNESILATVLDPRFDVTRAALFDTSATVTETRNIDTLPDPTGINVQVNSYAPGKISMSLDRPAPAGAALIAAENFYPGWTATVDGKPAKTGRAQFALIGVELPEGAQNIELTFNELSYERGKLFTLMAIGLSVLILGWGIFAELRKVG